MWRSVGKGNAMSIPGVKLFGSVTSGLNIFSVSLLDSCMGKPAKLCDNSRGWNKSLDKICTARDVSSRFGELTGSESLLPVALFVSLGIVIFTACNPSLSRLAFLKIIGPVLAGRCKLAGLTCLSCLTVVVRRTQLTREVIFSGSANVRGANLDLPCLVVACVSNRLSAGLAKFKYLVVL